MNWLKRIYTLKKLKYNAFAVVVVSPLVYALSGHWIYILEVFCVGMVMLPLMERILDEWLKQRSEELT